MSNTFQPVVPQIVARYIDSSRLQFGQRELNPFAGREQFAAELGGVADMYGAYGLLQCVHAYLQDGAQNSPRVAALLLTRMLQNLDERNYPARPNRLNRAQPASLVNDFRSQASALLKERTELDRLVGQVRERLANVDQAKRIEPKLLLDIA